MSEDLITHILTKKCSDVQDDTEKYHDPFDTGLQSPVTDLQPSVLPPTVLYDIDLHLECDEDGMVSVPGETTNNLGLSHSVIGQNVRLRITFPIPKQDIEKKEISWQCSFCKEKFHRQRKLAVHLRNIHNIEKGFQCSFCSFSTTEKRLLTRHCRKKHSGQKESTDLTNSFHPLSLQPDSDDLTKSDLCLNKDSQEIPLSLEKGSSDLQLETESSDYAESHLQFTGTKSKDPFCFVCSKCSYKTAFKHRLANHYTNIHDLNREPLKCKFCDFTCKKKDTFIIHEKKHSVSKSSNICNVCGKDCVSSIALKRHKLCHSDDTKAVCEIDSCGKEFKNINAMRSHMYKIHKQSKDKSAHGENSAVTKPFVCPWQGCSKSFRDNYNLKAHMCLHSGDKPLGCPHCAFRCVQKTSLSYHIKKMHNE